MLMLILMERSSLPQAAVRITRGVHNASRCARYRTRRNDRYRYGIVDVPTLLLSLMALEG